MTRRLLVRHAHAGRRGTWPGDDLERELSARGREQADGLVAVLRRLRDDLGTVASSRAVRCVDTVAPLATDLGVEVETAPVLLEGADPAEALAWLLRPDAPDVACSHGDVIGGVVELLRDRGVAIPPMRWPKAGTWVLDVDDGAVVAARLEPPPER